MRKNRISRAIQAACCSIAILSGTTAIHADEGMWLPSEISEKIADMQAKGLNINAEDLYSETGVSLKDAIVLFGRGCTGELISPDGLLLTNHHCGYGQIQAHSSIDHDYLTDGFWAMSRDEELPNDGLTVSFLVRMENVTDKVLKGCKPGTEEEKRLKIIEKNSEKLIRKAEKEGVAYKAEILPLYYGNMYYMYVYQVFSDVRLVGAPPSSIGKFGGDTDNWMWPRHTGDFSLFRIYADKNNNPAPYSEDNVPFRPKNYLRISVDGVKEGDFTFVYGYPGSTQEYILSDEVDYIANVSNPHKIALRTIRLDIQNKAMLSSDEIRIKYASKNAGVANAWKKWQGEMKGLRRLGTVDDKAELEKNFNEWASGGHQEYEGLIDSMKSIIKEMKDYKFARDYYTEAVFAVEAAGMISRYMAMDVQDREKYAGTFFKDYSLPIDRETFIALTGEFMENISPDYYPEYFKSLLGDCGNDMARLADTLFSNSVFTDYERLKAAFEEELESDTFSRLVTAFRKFYNDSIVSRTESMGRQLNLMYRTYMKGLMEFDTARVFYPDANLTLRIAYGNIKGYSPSDGVYYLPSSTIDGIIEKDNPEIYDYNIPQRLRDVYAEKDFGRWAQDGTVPVAFIATNHTTGGNSGSPVLDSCGRLIGINFDRVWEGTMSDIVFDPDVCRNIALDVRYILFIIDKIAGAGHLLEEMGIAAE